MHMAQRMPLPLTVSCFSKIQIGFTFLVPAHPGSPGKRAVKRACDVCVASDRPAVATACARITRSAEYAVSDINTVNKPSVCLSRRSTAAAVASGFPAEVGRGQQISTNSCCRATRGPRKFWSDCKEVQHTC